MAKKKDIQSFASDDYTRAALEELMEDLNERNQSALIRDAIDYALQHKDGFRENRRTIRDWFADRPGFQPAEVALFCLFGLVMFLIGVLL